MIPMSERFVIHIHSGSGRRHYDMMLADGDALATWQLLRSPLGLAEGESIPARRIQPHRAAYLEYEGPVSRDRGRVDRLDAGTYERLATGQTCWRVHLHGHRLAGPFELSRPDEQTDDWTLRRLPNPDAP